MESFREFISLSLLLSSVFAILFVASGIFVACYIVQPGIYKLLDWILGAEHRAAKREREAQAAAHGIAWEKAEAARRETEKARGAEEWAQAVELERRMREHVRRKVHGKSAPEFGQVRIPKQSYR